MTTTPLSVYHALFARMPSSARSGRHEAVRKFLVAVDDFHDAIARTNARDDFSAIGKSREIAKTAKPIFAAISRARGQLAHLQKQIAQADAAIHEKAIGEARATDAEYRSYLRSQAIGERTQTFLNDPAARGAALREPGLSGLSKEVLSDGLAIAIGEVAPDEAARLAVDREVETIFAAAIDTATREVMATPLITEESGNVRPFNSIRELEASLSDAVGMQFPKDVTLAEVEIDAVAAE